MPRWSEECLDITRALIRVWMDEIAQGMIEHKFSFGEMAMVISVTDKN